MINQPLNLNEVLTLLYCDSFAKPDQGESELDNYLTVKDLLIMKDILTAVNIADHLWLLNPHVFHYYVQGIGGSQMNIITVNTVFSYGQKLSRSRTSTKDRSQSSTIVSTGLTQMVIGTQVWRSTRARSPPTIKPPILGLSSAICFGRSPSQSRSPTWRPNLP